MAKQSTKAPARKSAASKPAAKSKAKAPAKSAPKTATAKTKKVSLTRKATEAVSVVAARVVKAAGKAAVKELNTIAETALAPNKTKGKS